MKTIERKYHRKGFRYIPSDTKESIEFGLECVKATVHLCSLVSNLKRRDVNHYRSICLEVRRILRNHIKFDDDNAETELYIEGVSAMMGSSSGHCVSSFTPSTLAASSSQISLF